MSKDIEQKAITITIEPPAGEPAGGNWIAELGMGVVVAIIAGVVLSYIRSRRKALK